MDVRRIAYLSAVLRIMLPLFVVCVFLSVILASRAQAQTAPGSGPVYAVEMRGMLTNAAISYLRRSLQEAEAARANALIITVGSGGGVLREVRPLAAEIAAAKVPIIVFISPSGTQSGATGAFLMSAAHISAMAPDTSFGSLYPLSLLNAARPGPSQTLIADSVADQLRDWNRTQGRSVVWVEQAVQQGAILTNEQATATDPPAVNLVAADLPQLLTLLDGRIVVLDDGSSIQLSTLGREPIAVTPTLIDILWQLLAEPNTVFALLILGTLAIYLEFAAPGTSLFAGIGAIMLIGALIGLVALPLTWWALGLIVLAMVLLGLEFVATSHGGLTIAGLILLVIGGLNLIDPIQAPGVSVAPWAVGIIVLVLTVLIAGGLWLALRARVRPAVTGGEALVGRVGEVRRRLDPQGMVFLDGALWQAVSEEQAVEAGEWVKVVSVHRLQLIVRPVERTPDGD
jgi:membrane-bound serine protease (ClpP class)